MRLILLAVSLILVSGLLSACGTGSHRYTVRQVKGAFAAEHVKLERSREPLLSGSGAVVLHHGTKSRFIAVLVETAPPDKGPLTYFARSPGERGDHITKDGNIFVSFDPSNASTVRAAIARLH